MMRKIFFLLMILVFEFGSVSHATIGVPDSTHWILTGFGGGGNFTAVVPDKFVNHKVYLLPDVTSPYVSTDSGDNWTKLSYKNTNSWTPKTAAILVQSKNNADLFYAGDFSNGVFKSTDHGLNWTRVLAGSINEQFKNIAIDPNDDNTVYVGLANNIIKKTVDGSANWTTFYTASHIIDFIYVAPDSSYLFFGNGLGLNKLDSSTAALTTIVLAPTTMQDSTFQVDYDTYIDGLSVEHFCTTAGLEVACTANGGGTWTYTANATTAKTVAPFVEYYMDKFAVHYRSDTNLNFVVHMRIPTSNSSSSKFRYSTNSGSTWADGALHLNTTESPSQTAYGGISNQNCNMIAHDPFNQDTFYFTNIWTHFRSDNVGLDWYEKVKHAQITVATDIAIAPNGTIFVSNMDAGVQRSTDNGDTWAQAYPLTLAHLGHYWRVVTLGTLANWNAGSGIVIALSNWWSDFRPRVERSVDNGVTWSDITTSFPAVALYGDSIWGNGFFRSIGVSHDKTTIYAGMDGENCQADVTKPANCTTNIVTGGTWKSSDYGATWTRKSSDPRKVYNAIAVDPTDATNATMLFGTFGYNLWRSTQSGTNYAYISNGNPGNYIYDATYDTQGRPYAVGTDSGAVVWKSVVTVFGNENGSYGTWILMKRFFSVNSGIADGILIDPLNDNRLFVSVTLASGGSATSGNKVFVTPDAQDAASATWYDISGDLPMQGGCQSLALNASEGTEGYLYCAANGGSLLKIDLADSPVLAAAGTVKVGGN